MIMISYMISYVGYASNSQDFSNPLKSSKIQGIQYLPISVNIQTAFPGNHRGPGLTCSTCRASWVVASTRFAARPCSSSSNGKAWEWLGVIRAWEVVMLILLGLWYGDIWCICMYLCLCFVMFFFPPARCWSLDLYQNISDTPHTYTRPPSRARLLSRARRTARLIMPDKMWKHICQIPCRENKAQNVKWYEYCIYQTLRVNKMSERISKYMSGYLSEHLPQWGNHS